MDMGDMDMGGMDMGGSGSGAACKISMLWNWYTVDSCFLASTWHVRSKAQFAGSVIGVFFLVMAIEGLRRLSREYDKRLVAANRALVESEAEAGCCEAPQLAKVGSGKQVMLFSGSIQPTRSQQIVRGLFYGAQFTAAFLVMLLGMYFNGFILLAIFLGGTAGYIVFGGDTLACPQTGMDGGNCC